MDVSYFTWFLTPAAFVVLHRSKWQQSILSLLTVCSHLSSRRVKFPPASNTKTSCQATEAIYRSGLWLSYSLSGPFFALSYLMEIDGSYTFDRCETKRSETPQHSVPLQHQLFHEESFGVNQK